MKSKTIPASRLSSITLAADARLCQPDYTNDLIWELAASVGNPGILLQSTLGLRARSFRMFPRFIRKDASISDPGSFFSPSTLLSIFPNYASIRFEPFSDIPVTSEYWVRDSQSVSGKLTISNQTNQTENLTIEWIASLNFIEEGHAMAATTMENVQILEGRSAGLFLVCFLSGGSQPGIGPMPGLSVQFQVTPGTSQELGWSFAAGMDIKTAFLAARTAANRAWLAEIAQIERVNESFALEITTGDPDWDEAFTLSQRTAWSLFFPSSSCLPCSSFVLSRRSDQGYSIRGNGADYAYQWNGQTAMDAIYLAGLILPGGAVLAEGLLNNFLAIQDESGFIDWKPGLIGQRSRHLAQPFLATLAWMISQAKPDPEWLKEIYPKLLLFYQTWFSPEHDRDGDGFPEWDHPLQTGTEECPIYDRWHPAAQGIEISSLESPGLAAFLFREGENLIHIANAIGETNWIPWISEKLETLQKNVASAWDNVACTYYYRDYQSHLSQPPTEILDFSSPGIFRINKTTRKPNRLQIKIETGEDITHPVRLAISGKNGKQVITEQVTQFDLFWSHGHATYTSQNLFTNISKVEVKELPPDSSGKLSSCGYRQEDSTLLLPLWAGIPTSKQKKNLIEHTLLPRYLLPFGISLCPDNNQAQDLANQTQISLPINQFFVESLFENGYEQEAETLFNRLMNAVVKSIKLTGGVREFYDARTGCAYGEMNNLRGLAPIGLFLKLAGIINIQNDVVIFQGINPFPWPVTVKYHGVEITRHAQDTVVTFPGGQSISVSGSGPHRVSLS